MLDEFERRQRTVLGIAILPATEHRRAAVAPIKCEPALIAPFQPQRLPLAHAGVPDDFGEADALADRVENIEHFVRQFVTVDPAPHHVCYLDIPGAVAGRVHGDFQLRHRSLARPQHARIMHVAFFDLFGQFEIGERVAHVGRAHDPGEPNGVQSVSRITGKGRANPADRGRRDLLPQNLFAEGMAPMIDQHGHAHCS